MAGGRASFAVWGIVVSLCACTSPGSIDDAGPGAGDASPICASASDCDDLRFCNGPERCAPDDARADERGCVADPAPCGATELCDEPEARCRERCSVAPDLDGDGALALACGGDDCDDDDAARFPGGAEVCDEGGHDEDCDPSTFGARDADGDGFVSALCCNGKVCGEDCDDGRADVSPIASEVCDRVDGDCDGIADEGVAVPGFLDLDRDGDGDPAMPIVACPGFGGMVSLGTDCDDADPARRPGQPEICDAVDNDCDGTVDEGTGAVLWYRDLDGDRFGARASGAEASCAPLAGYSLFDTDCDDGDASRSPAAAELCNGRDDDCNGVADFELAPGDLEDDDRDGSADAACPGGTDCDDESAFAAPTRAEACNGADDDCDGAIDEEGASLWFADGDGDGYGDDGGSAFAACFGAAGHAPRGGDCDDADPARAPGARERCDAIDDDCDGAVDEGPECTVTQVAVGDRHGCVLLAGGGVRCWGSNGQGQLGDGTTTSRAVPAPVIGLDDAVAITSGALHACAIRRGGSVVCWGAGGQGEIGDGALVDRAAPVAVAVADAVRIDAGYAYTCALRAGGAVWCWGENSRGQMGDGTTSPRSTPAPTASLAGALDLAAGDFTLCVRLAGGEVRCAGRNDRGQVGDGTTADRAVPATVAGLEPGARRLAAGPDVSCALLESGAGRCWGLGGLVDPMLPLVQPTPAAALVPRVYGAAEGVSAGTGLCWWLGSGRAYCLGGAVGHADATPEPVTGLSEVRALDAGRGHVCAVEGARAVYCWGDNQFMQLGSASVGSASELPVRVRGL